MPVQSISKALCWQGAAEFEWKGIQERKKGFKLQNSCVSLSPSIGVFDIHTCIWVLLEASKSPVVLGHPQGLVNIRPCSVGCGNFAFPFSIWEGTSRERSGEDLQDFRDPVKQSGQ